MQYSITDLPSLANAVRRRREQLGLTQDRLASLVGLSRATINALENGLGADPGFTKVARLLQTIGLYVSISDAKAVPNAAKCSGLNAAALTASTSYRTVLPPQVLAHAVRTGQIPAEYRAHMATLLDEAPITLIVSAVEESFRAAVPKGTWRHFATWARDFKSTRQVWI